VETLAEPLAWLLIVAAPLVALAAVVGVSRWSHWLVGAGGMLGVVGLVVTGAATLNVLVARTCATDASGKTIERPIISAATGEGDCFRTAWGQLQLVALTGVGASVAVFATRARRGGGAPAPGAPRP
jgi:hypothetical protein